MPVSIEHETDVQVVQRICGAWCALIDAADRANNGTIEQAEAPEWAPLSIHCRMLLHSAMAFRPEQSAPHSGFYFCGRCGGHFKGALNSQLEESVTTADIIPIYAYVGVSLPSCEYCGGEAVWVGSEGQSALAERFGLDADPFLPPRGDYLPKAFEVLYGAEAPRNGVDPALVPVSPAFGSIAYMAHEVCPNCGRTARVKRSRLGRVVRCHSCEETLTLSARPIPEFRVRFRCHQCRQPVSGNPRCVGTTAKCPDCGAETFVAAPDPSGPSVDRPLKEALEKPSKPLIPETPVDSNVATTHTVEEAARAPLLEEIESLLSEIEEQKAVIDEGEVRRKEIEYQLTEQSELLAEVARERDAVLEELRRHRENTVRHGERAADDEKKLRSREKRTALLSEKLGAVEAKLDALMSKYQSVLGASARRKVRFKNLRRQLVSSEDQISQMEEALADLQANSEDLEESVSERDRRLTEVQANAERLESELSQAGREIAQNDQTLEEIRLRLETEIAEKQSELAVLRESMESAESQARISVSRLKFAEADLDDARGEIMKLGVELNEQQARIHAGTTDFQRRIETLERELASKKYEAEEHSHRAKLLGEDVESAQSELIQERDARTSLDEKQRTLKEQLGELKARCESLSEESRPDAPQTAQLKQLEETVNELRAEIEQKQQMIADLQNELAASDGWNSDSPPENGGSKADDDVESRTLDADVQSGLGVDDTDSIDFELDELDSDNGADEDRLEFEDSPLSSELDTAVQLHAERRFDESERVCLQGLKKDPNHPELQRILGANRLQLGDLNEAVKAFLACAKSGRPALEQRIFCYREIGKIYGQLGKFRKSRKAFHAALDLDPDDEATHRNLGMTLANMGRLREAADHWTTSLRINPSQPGVERLLADARSLLDIESRV
jgi:tetratricopeptide (TPR) repeat protein